ncbi:ribonuclease-3 [Metschnikowia aff. pulcherrima]|uniref:ribonuclease III n=1 Tax=Metschnikowia aff. pulcherrima TaxID=2163413 RepID=A0A4P6XTQ8_9ASCO|nr:ribonuclease-3 [Metschnikowia aff. pulcherrima]
MSQDGLNDFLKSLQEAATGVPSSKENRPVKKQKMTSSLLDPARLGNSASFGYTEINKFEHCARSLQKNVRTIVEEAPTMTQLTSYFTDNTLDKFAKQEAKTNPLLLLVSKLKTLYSTRQLSIFDQILENNVIVKATKSSPSEPVAKRELDELDDEPEIFQGLPPLPKIRSPELRLRVFQHKSTCANKTYLNDLEIVLTHNERMEFLGDSVLNTAVTFILYRRFPTANEGQMSQMRSLLVSNKVLGEFSVAYGFDKQLRCNIDEEALKLGKQKVFADVFEAYIGALAMERGYDLKEVEKWLEDLLANKIAIASKELRKLTPVDKEAKTELYSLIGSASLHPVYKVVENGNGINTPYKVHCMMEDTVIGEGEAPSLKEAGLKAAMSALLNKEMLEKYGRKRLETDRSVTEVKPANDGADNSAPSTSKFPLLADKSTLPNKFAKNEAYAYFGKNLGLTPEYIVVFEEDNKRFKAELKVKEAVLAVAYDASKKNAISRAAAVLLENKQLLNEIVSLVN